MFLSIGMLKQKYFLTDIFILSTEKQPIKLSWRKIEWLQKALLLYFYNSKCNTSTFSFVGSERKALGVLPESLFTSLYRCGVS